MSLPQVSYVKLALGGFMVCTVVVMAVAVMVDLNMPSPAKMKPSATDRIAQGGGVPYQRFDWYSFNAAAQAIPLYEWQQACTVYHPTRLR